VSVCVCTIQCYNQGLSFKCNHSFAESRTPISEDFILQNNIDILQDLRLLFFRKEPNLDDKYK